MIIMFRLIKITTTAAANGGTINNSTTARMSYWRVYQPYTSAIIMHICFESQCLE